MFAVAPSNTRVNYFLGIDNILIELLNIISGYFVGIDKYYIVSNHVGN